MVQWRRFVAQRWWRFKDLKIQIGDGAMKENRSPAMVKVRRSKDSDRQWCWLAMVLAVERDRDRERETLRRDWKSKWIEKLRVSEPMRVWTRVENIKWQRTGLYTRSTRVDWVLEGKTHHSTHQNQFGMVGTCHRPPSNSVEQLLVRVWLVWPGGSGLLFCWTGPAPTV